MHPKQVTNIIIHNIIASLEHKIEQFQQSVKMGKMSGWVWPPYEMKRGRERGGPPRKFP